MKKSYYVPTSEPVKNTSMLCYEWDTNWQHPVAADAICPDGKVRRVRLNQSADTFFSWSGRVSYQGKTRKCFVSSDSDGVLVCHIDGFNSDGSKQEETQ